MTLRGSRLKPPAPQDDAVTQTSARTRPTRCGPLHGRNMTVAKTLMAESS